jgi:hypothetical protein
MVGQRWIVPACETCARTAKRLAQLELIAAHARAIVAAAAAGTPRDDAATARVVDALLALDSALVYLEALEVDGA